MNKGMVSKPPLNHKKRNDEHRNAALRNLNYQYANKWRCRGE